MFLGCKVRRVRRADNLTAICELQGVSQFVNGYCNPNKLHKCNTSPLLYTNGCPFFWNDHQRT
jgi:hypothetical protein